jgi:hypothetical protein
LQVGDDLNSKAVASAAAFLLLELIGLRDGAFGPRIKLAKW